MKLKYDIADRPKPFDLFSLALQQMLTILAGTIALPLIVGNGLSPSTAMFGAGAGSAVYILLTRRRSPAFLGSSFSFIGPMLAAFAGGVTMQLGMLGLIIGAVLAGMVYVLLSVIVKKFGIKWIDKVMPPVVIGPTVSIIGLSLAGNAIGDIQTGNVCTINELGEKNPVASPHIALLCGFITIVFTVIISIYSKRTLRLIPFLIGIIGGYAAALCFTFAGIATDTDALKLIDLEVFRSMMLPDGGLSVSSFISVPDFVFIKAFSGISQLSAKYVITIAAAYVPVSFVVFAEHIADHKNLSSIVNRDLLTDPGLNRTLLGDAFGSMVGAFFGGCPNTTYGESIACVALTGNASVATIFCASAGCMLLAFITPFVAFVSSVPNCVMGGICILLYGFIAVSGFKMIQHIDLEDNRNIFVISTIFVTGIGGLTLHFGNVTVTEIAVALILGAAVNLIAFAKEPKND